MPRQVEDAKIQTKTQRAKLAVRGTPYYRRISDSLHIGYRRTATLPGRWLVRRRGADGKYTQTAMRGVVPDDVAEANNVDILTFDQAGQLARGVHAPAADDVTLEKALDTWVAMKLPNLSTPKRVADTQSQASRIVRGFEPGIKIRDLTVESIESFRDASIHGKEDDKLQSARSTANKNLRILKAALNHTVKVKKLEMDRPWDHVQQFKAQESFGKRVLAFDAEQSQAWVDAAEDEPTANLIYAALLTGARFGELAGVRVRDYSPKRLALTGKTGTRTIVLCAKGDALFGGLADRRNNDRAFLLEGRDGVDSWHEGAQSDPVRRAAIKAGLPEETVLYTARHTYITRHLTQGVPAAAIAKQCGTSVAMIEKTYANFMVTDLERWFGEAVL